MPDIYLRMPASGYEISYRINIKVIDTKIIPKREKILMI